MIYWLIRFLFYDLDWRRKSLPIPWWFIQNQRKIQWTIEKSIQIDPIETRSNSRELQWSRRSAAIFLSSSFFFLRKSISIWIEQIRDPSHRALFCYWKGRAFNIFPEYDKRATDYLSKAALLQPSNVTTLNELGESYAKNGEFEMAANCFKNAHTKVVFHWKIRRRKERFVFFSKGKKSIGLTKSIDCYSTISSESNWS